MKTKSHTSAENWSGNEKFQRLALAFLLLAFGSSHAADVRDGIVSYWPLDSINENITPDAAFTNAMSVVGTPTVGPGKFGNAFTFANNIYLTNLHAPDAFPTVGLPIYSASSYTLCMWVKGANQTAKYLYTEGNLTTTTPLFILQTGNTAANNAKFDVLIRNDASVTLMNHVVSSTVVFDNTWHHIAWVDDNGSAKLYVDGVLDATSFNYTKSGVFTLNTSAIGTLVRTTVASSAVFNGQIDDIATWERPLSQVEIQSVMTNGIVTPLTPISPSLYEMPVSANRNLGDWNIFTARAYAHRPDNIFTYQWYKNGSLIPDATSRTYQTEHLTLNNSGDYYSVEVANGIGLPVASSNAVLTVQADPAANVQLSLMNYWPLDTLTDENGNLTTPDLYSRANLALTNEMTVNNLVDGHIGKCLSFDGLTNIAYRISGAPISLVPSYSLSMWVMGDYQFQNDRRVFSEGSPTNNNPLMTIGTQSDGQGPSAGVFIRTDTGAGVVNGRRSASPVFDNTWHHLVWTDSNGQGRLYVDGVLDFTDYTYNRAARTVLQTSLGGVMRGASTGNFFFGQIDEVGAWSRALTWTEVQQIYADGIPMPVAEIPPAFLTQPSSLTNNVWIQQDATFSATVSGTSPWMQWFKDGAPISTNLNPSAGTATLMLTNIQLSANGSYWLMASNSAAVTNSDIVQLLAQTFTTVSEGEVLKIDAGLAGAPNLQPGFDEFTIGVNGTSYNSVGVTLSPIGSLGFQARNRVTDSPLWVTDSPPFLSQASIYNDFIYANSTTANLGMRILVERLAPNTPFGVTIWSFDRASTGELRVSDWTETSSGTPIPVATGYTFGGSIPPTNDFQNTMGGLFTSSPTGKLQFEGRNVSGGLTIFFNGMRLVARPTGTKIKQLGLVEGNLRVQVEGDYQGQPIILQESSSLAPAAWGTATGALSIQTNGPAVIFQVPTGNSSMFYRAVSHSAW